MSARRQRVVCVGKSNNNSPRNTTDTTYELFHSSRGGLPSPTAPLPSDYPIPISPRIAQSQGGSTQQATRSVPFLPSLPAQAYRNTRSSANPHYPIDMTRHMVQSDIQGAGYISPRDQFGPERYTLQQQHDREQRLALQGLHASNKGRAERDIVSGREAADRVKEAREAMRIEVKKQQRESYEQRVAEISERERRSARQWL